MFRPETNNFFNNNMGQPPQRPRFDSRNRTSLAMYQKLGGVPTEEEVVAGVLSKIEWKKLNLPKFRRDFSKVIFYFF